MGTRDDYTTHSEAKQALFELQRYARDLGVSLESVIQSLIREDMVNTTCKDPVNVRVV
ncbi:hypothetical protein EVC27_010 [Rhizobium phage RHph_I1_6]|uniref:Uncharacterized protein n=1 Tax=Rhizobium phage RHph_I1_6 TaxID=2509728 RepID=A0A7S5RFH7_9CAUD|nr:hypothetical protein PP745_gp010 [Rhizobium phage RHph_I1_6]QIG76535.1 hypothetical protein EVC27_010 [Rhizobium phage RHph_I1_6]